MPVNAVLQTKEKKIKKSVRILWFWTPVIFWMTIIFFFSSLPPSGVPFIDIPNIDKFFHCVEYFILGALLVRAFWNSASNPDYKYILVASILIGAIYGASDEFHQLFTPGRSCEFFDFLTDVIGTAIGAGLYSYKERIYPCRR